jgi:hypothetical protein
MGMGRGKTIMPFVEVGLGPQFMTERKGLKGKVDEWGWTLALEGQFGLMFRLFRFMGLRVGVGFSSVSIFDMKHNYGGIWMTASVVFGLPRGRPYHPPPPPPPPPKEKKPTSHSGSFSIDAWTYYVADDQHRPVLEARLVRSAGFEGEVSIWLEMPDGSEYELSRVGLEDPDLWELPLYAVGMECGSQTVTVHGKSGWDETETPVYVYLPCPELPEGM